MGSSNIKLILVPLTILKKPKRRFQIVGGAGRGCVKAAVYEADCSSLNPARSKYIVPFTPMPKGTQTILCRRFRALTPTALIKQGPWADKSEVNGNCFEDIFVPNVKVHTFHEKHCKQIEIECETFPKL